MSSSSSARVEHSGSDKAGRRIAKDAIRKSRRIRLGHEGAKSVEGIRLQTRLDFFVAFRLEVLSTEHMRREGHR